MRFSRIVLCALMAISAGRVAGAAQSGIRIFRMKSGEHAALAPMLQDGAPDSIASVSGTVADGSSKPLAGVTVTIKNAAGVSQSARTDSKGKYWIGSLAAGTYTITVRAKGFKNFEVAGIPLAAGDSVPLDVLMEAGVSE
ncbi:MAG: carboxypeptidase-like regulatory domain-containing protein, partial [Candidatus Sulfotelmatobacter sp.]